MKRPAASAARFSQLLFGWAVVFSLLLGWIGAEPRLPEFPAQSASADFGAVQAPDHAAILAVSGKFDRPPEYRLGGDPDPLALASEIYRNTRGILLDTPICGWDAPDCRAQHQLPEPRAPPAI